MIYPCRQLIFLLTWLWLLQGCTSSNRVDDLMAENPFRTKENIKASSTRIMGCEYITLELAGHVDVSQLSGWADSGVAGNTQAMTTASGFPANQIALWKKNGFEVFISPISVWPGLRKSILKAGGKSLSQMTAIFRNRSEHADFGAMWQEQEQSLFITSLNGELSGQTLGMGRCGFRVTCQPTGNIATSNSLLVNITPIFMNSQAQEQYERDDFGVLRLIRKYPEKSFDSLTLRGTVPNGYFIGIAKSHDDEPAGTLGRFFLTHAQPPQDTQIVCLLIPQIESLSTPQPNTRQ